MKPPEIAQTIRNVVASGFSQATQHNFLLSLAHKIETEVLTSARSEQPPFDPKEVDAKEEAYRSEMNRWIEENGHITTVAGLIARLAVAEGEVKELRGQLEGERATHDKSLGDLAAARVEIESLREDLAEALTRIDDLKSIIETLRSVDTSRRSAYELLRESNDSLRRDRDRFAEVIRLLRNDLARLSGALKITIGGAEEALRTTDYPDTVGDTPIKTG